MFQNFGLLPNKTVKLTPFEVNFGRKPKTELSKFLPKPNLDDSNYHYLKKQFRKENPEEN